VLEPQRQNDFLQLAGNGAFLGQEQILGELLGQGRAALRGAAMQHVGNESARDAQRIDAAMGVEAAILDGDEGVRHVIRQFADWHRGAAHVAARRQGRAGVAEDQHRRRALRNFQRLDRRQAHADKDQHADGGDQRPQRQHRAPIERAADEDAAPAGAAAFAFGFALALPSAGRVGVVIAVLAPPRRRCSGLPGGTLIRALGRRADPVFRGQVQIVEAGAAAALSSLSPRHERSPARTASDRNLPGLRRGY
jgi:hypothetical protein